MGILEERLINFATMILKLVEHLPRTLSAHRIGDQLARCSTSVGANYEEASAAESKQDFVHKIQIALKESRESCYWLKVISKGCFLQPVLVEPALDEALQIRAMLSKAVSTAKSRMTQ